MLALAWGAGAAVVLAGVFLLSAITKLASPAAWRAQAVGLGVPAPLAAPVPFGEAVLGAWLLVQWHRPLAAWTAAGVLVVFTALLVARLAQGQRPPCACFGAWSTTPIGPGHVARNTAFLALAVFAALA